MTNPIGISNDIMAAAPGDAYLGYAVRRLRHWNRWMGIKYIQASCSTSHSCLSSSAHPALLLAGGSLLAGQTRSLWVGAGGRMMPTLVTKRSCRSSTHLGAGVSILLWRGVALGRGCERDQNMLRHVLTSGRPPAVPSPRPQVMFSTGPMFLTVQYSLFPKRDDVAIINKRVYGKYEVGWGGG